MDCDINFPKNAEAIEVNGLIYIIGGGKAAIKDFYRECYSLEIKEGKLISLSKLEGPRYLHLLVKGGINNNNIYAIGGNNGRPLKKCERYSIKDDKWMKIASLTKPKQAMGGCYMENTESIWIIGGFDGGACCNHFEVYDINKNIFTYIKIQSTGEIPWTARFWNAVTPLNSTHILIFGGYSRIVFKLNTHTNEIVSLQGKLPERAAFYYPCCTFVRSGDSIYALATKSWKVFKFGLGTEEWEFVSSFDK